MRRSISSDTSREAECARENHAFFSGEYPTQIGRAKERALQAYRDQERRAQDRAAEIRAREGTLHAYFRIWQRLPAVQLSAPERVLPVLQRWASPATQHMSATDEPTTMESDPRFRTIEQTLAYLDERPKALN
jgi:hypothetical protein